MPARQCTAASPAWPLPITPLPGLLKNWRRVVDCLLIDSVRMPDLLQGKML